MKEVFLTADVSFGGNFDTGITELTADELLLVSGGDISDNMANVLAFGHSVLFGAASGGLSAALMSAYNSGGWAHAGLGGMAVGAVGGALNHIKGK